MIDAQYTWHRFKTHILWGLCHDTTRLLVDHYNPPVGNSRASSGQGGSAIFLLIKCVVTGVGICSGGVVVGLVNWIHDTLVGFSVILASLVLLVVVGIGPDLMPPITPVNGCEEISLRLCWTLTFGVIRWCLPQYWILILWTVSGIWHLDRGDFDFRAGAKDLAEHLLRLEQSGQRERAEQVLADSPKFLLLHFFRVGAGLGNLLITYHFFTWSFFLSTTALFVGANLLLFLVHGRRHID